MTPEWVTAWGTLLMAATAAVTICRDQIREWIRHPKWEILFEPKPPDCNRIRIELQQQILGARGAIDLVRAEAHWIRARVKNVGKAGAQDVEVSVIEVKHKGIGDRVFKRMSMSTPWNLSWKDLMGSGVLARLPVDGERCIDFGHVVDPQERKRIRGEDLEGSDPAATLFCLAFTIKSNTGEYLLAPGEYEIDFRVFAANARASSTFTFCLNHTGQWFLDEDRMYHDGLGMSIKRR